MKGRTGLRVKAGGWLIKKNELRVTNQSDRHIKTPTLTSGKLTNTTMGLRRKPNCLQ